MTAPTPGAGGYEVLTDLLLPAWDAWFHDLRTARPGT